MSNFTRICTDIAVGGILNQIDAHPELWNENPERLFPGSPMEGTSDIWLRYRDKAELTSREAYREPHFAVWYPGAKKLGRALSVVRHLMWVIEADYIGGVLITKIPAGRSILPHSDAGSWHAEFMNVKVYIPLQTNLDCVNICEDEHVSMMAGDAWTFDNLKTHSVVNSGKQDRITLIVSLRKD